MSLLFRFPILYEVKNVQEFQVLFRFTVGWPWGIGGGGGIVGIDSESDCTGKRMD